MQKCLKKDIVIPAGAVLNNSPVRTERHGNDHFECVDDPALSDWFDDNE